MITVKHFIYLLEYCNPKLINKDTIVFADMFADQNIYSVALMFGLQKRFITEVINQARHLDLFNSIFNAEFLQKEI